MEPRIQYAQTEDGESIAFWTLGGGMPLVDIWPSPLNHIQWRSGQPTVKRKGDSSP